MTITFNAFEYRCPYDPALHEGEARCGAHSEVTSDVSRVASGARLKGENACREGICTFSFTDARSAVAR